MSNTPSYWSDWRIRGIPSDIWVRFADPIGQLITKSKLTPVDSRHLVTANQVAYALAGQAAVMASTSAETTKAKQSATETFDIRGGMKAPHVHYKGGIYMLNDAQWKSFTTLVINDFKSKLDSAGAISFDRALDISETASKMG